ncbi:hypothetical protein SUGI_0855970 [Cryptomeria japonica]|nr:hypothetical protein SUGI_0855970 [Cryptomeria japonica]
MLRNIPMTGVTSHEFKVNPFLCNLALITQCSREALLRIFSVMGAVVIVEHTVWCFVGLSGDSNTIVTSLEVLPT